MTRKTRGSFHGRGLVKAIVEKPSRESAPSNLVLYGRYVFSEDTAELLNEYSYENLVNFNQ